MDKLILLAALLIFLGFSGPEKKDAIPNNNKTQKAPARTTINTSSGTYHPGDTGMNRFEWLAAAPKQARYN